MLGRILLMAACTIVPQLIVDETAAQQTGFRVETDLFLGSESKPFHQTVTLFSGGVAYDFPRDDSVVTMVDPKRGRIVLLDVGRQKQTEVDLVDVEKLVESGRNTLLASPETAVLVSDGDKVRFEGDKVIAGGELLRYEATLQQPENPQVALEYRTYTDALTRLNAVHNPTALPFARLSLNYAALEKQSLPKELTRYQSSARGQQIVRSILHANWRLSLDDKAKIAEIGRMLVSFESVSQQEFFRGQHSASAGNKTAGR